MWRSYRYLEIGVCRETVQQSTREPHTRLELAVQSTYGVAYAAQLGDHQLILGRDGEVAQRCQRVTTAILLHAVGEAEQGFDLRGTEHADVVLGIGGE